MRISDLGVALHLVETSGGECGSLSILAVRRGSELVAIAPFCPAAGSVSSARPFSVLEFLGSGFVGSDYLDVIVRKGGERGSLPGAGSWLAGEAELA